jgi:outer membrane protein OmpA-like peptidoglycan-associated protein
MQSLDQPYQAVTVERSDLLPGAPFKMDPMEVQRLFGPTIGILPEREVQFVLYFVENQDVLIPESEAQLPTIITTIRERRSTAVSVTGHTDMTGSSEANYKLGLKRAERVAEILIKQGMDPANLFVFSHGETDPVVKTPRGIAEQKNRRVEVTVR